MQFDLINVQYVLCLWSVLYIILENLWLDYEV